jgi:hypothetical protein
LAISNVTGTPQLSLVSSTTGNTIAQTAFGSQCPGLAGNNTLKLGRDWTDVCGTSSGTPVTETTWGKIKDLYRGK